MKKNKVDKHQIKKDEKNVQSPKAKEQYGLHFSSSLKITDTDTGKVILKMRCD